jgi:hypothetical protein
LTTQAQAQLLPSIGIEGNLLKSGETKIQVAQDNE